VSFEGFQEASVTELEGVIASTEGGRLGGMAWEAARGSGDGSSYDGL
jgi:hypothetical protein